MPHQGTTIIQCDKCGREMDTGEVWHSRAYVAARREGWQTTDLDKRWRDGDDLCPVCLTPKRSTYPSPV